MTVLGTGQAYHTFFQKNIKVKGRQCPDYIQRERRAPEI